MGVAERLIKTRTGQVLFTSSGEFSNAALMIRSYRAAHLPMKACELSN
jgi:hypothetical protein